MALRKLGSQRTDGSHGLEGVRVEAIEDRQVVGDELTQVVERVAEGAREVVGLGAEGRDGLEVGGVVDDLRHL